MVRSSRTKPIALVDLLAAEVPGVEPDLDAVSFRVGQGERLNLDLDPVRRGLVFPRHLAGHCLEQGGFAHASFADQDQLRFKKLLATGRLLEAHQVRSQSIKAALIGTF